MKISEQVFIIINKDLLRNYIAVLHSKAITIFLTS